MSATTPAPPDTAATIGFAGLGRMGRPMAHHIVRSGHHVSVYNRTRAVAEEFAAATGSNPVSTPRELAEHCDVTITMVSDGEALLELIDGATGLAAGLGGGDVVVDMGTSGIAHTAEARARIEAAGAHLVEAPVSGSVASAEARSLLVMAAGESEPVAMAMPALQAIADHVVHVGGPGAGAAMKLAVNNVLFGINEAIAESLVLAERAGIERSVAYDVFASSAVAAPVVHYRRAVFEDPTNTPTTFSVDLAIKDLGMVLALARSVGAPMPQAEVNLAVMEAASDEGFGDADMGQIAVRLRGDL